MRIGEVTSLEPIRIRLDQKLSVSGSLVYLTKNVMDYTVKTTSTATTFNSNIGTITGKTESQTTIHNGLKVGDRVQVLVCNQGQKYIIIDKVY